MVENKFLSQFYYLNFLGSETRWLAEKSTYGRQIERLNDELIRSQRAREAVEAEVRRTSKVGEDERT